MNRPTTAAAVRTTGLTGLLAAAVLAGGGCSTGGEVRLTSVQAPVMVAPDLPHVVYIASDANTADIYMTDLSREELDPATDFRDVEGQIVHLHMFIAPRAGKTPIDQTACSVTVRHAIVANGAIGIYGGGGFLQTSGEAGDKRFGGDIRDATMRLVGSTPGFVDRLGSAHFQGSIRARRNEPLATLIGQRMDDIALLVDRQPTPEPRLPVVAEDAAAAEADAATPPAADEN